MKPDDGSLGVFLIPRTGGSFNREGFSKYPEPAVLWFWIFFQIPGTSGFLWSGLNYFLFTDSTIFIPNTTSSNVFHWFLINEKLIIFFLFFHCSVREKKKRKFMKQIYWLYFWDLGKNLGHLDRVRPRHKADPPPRMQIRRTKTKTR
jgi:hypothetical protein